MGRYIPVDSCNMYGDSACPYHTGAHHCVQGVQAGWDTVLVMFIFVFYFRETGGQQICCYDQDGWLMHSDDYEFYSDQLQYFSPGTPYRYFILEKIIK